MLNRYCGVIVIESTTLNRGYKLAKVLPSFLADELGIKEVVTSKFGTTSYIFFESVNPVNANELFESDEIEEYVSDINKCEWYNNLSKEKRKNLPESRLPKCLQNGDFMICIYDRVEKCFDEHTCEWDCGGYGVRPYLTLMHYFEAKDIVRIVGYLKASLNVNEISPKLEEESKKFYKHKIKAKRDKYYIEKEALDKVNYSSVSSAIDFLNIHNKSIDESLLLCESFLSLLEW